MHKLQPLQISKNYCVQVNVNVAPYNLF